MLTQQEIHGILLEKLSILMNSVISQMPIKYKWGGENKRTIIDVCKRIKPKIII